MKTLKRNIFIKSLLILFVVAFASSCKKDDGGDGGSNEAGKGTFTVNGTTHSGVCQSVPATSGVSGNIDVVIADAGGASFTIYNMPTGGSGISNFVEFTDSNGFSSELYALSIINQSTLYMSVSGTVTKTGSNSYKFNVNMTDPIEGNNVTITGSGKY
jgi:hypothetical protein